jgi:putative transcriptional regulator
MLTGIFSRSVILLLEHQEKKGTKGFIINHPTKDVPARILGTFGSNKIRVGGPVRTRHAELLHGTPSIGGHCITANNFSKEDKVFWGGDLEVAAKAVEEKQMLPKDLMFISGMSTWVPGQLENELQRGTWISVTAPLTIALDANKDLWQVLLKTLGKEYEAWSQIPQLPEDDDRL